MINKVYMEYNAKRLDRRSAYAELAHYCVFSMGIYKDEGNFIEVTEWSNEEGFDVEIHTKQSEIQFKITKGQLDALVDCVRSITE